MSERVQTAAGEAMRVRALGLLTYRHALLLGRSKRRQITEVERHELDRLAGAIDALQSMEAARATPV